ncbi:MAG TPA: aldehyde dehydrogenase family protein, partial [Candidatus Acidoferrum sp.]|nr:aldehyde dehydrogenase family protein [Candidatus Acidoferrum sp.]
MATTETTAVRPFTNEPISDYRKEENARAMREAIAKVRQELGREYDLVIGGQRIKTVEKIRSLNPAKPSEVVGIHQKAGREHVEPAMQAALKAFETWQYAPLAERVGVLRRTA